MFFFIGWLFNFICLLSLFDTAANPDLILTALLLAPFLMLLEFWFVQWIIYDVLPRLFVYVEGVITALMPVIVVILLFLLIASFFA